jgi:hypothetical protein
MQPQATTQLIMHLDSNSAKEHNFKIKRGCIYTDPVYTEVDLKYKSTGIILSTHLGSRSDTEGTKLPGIKVATNT